MKLTLLGMTALAALSLAACTETPTPPVDNPASTSMTYKQGARYEYSSKNTSATSGADTNVRTRTWTLVNTNATVQGRSNVAVYIDSIISGGGVITIADSVLLQQQSGTNDVYRYGSMLGELDLAAQIPFLGGLDLGRKWQQEARLNSTSGVWFTGEISDTVANTFGIPLVSGFKIALSDSAVASSTENLTIGGTSYATTKATHNMRLTVYALATVLGQQTQVEVASTVIPRRIWIAPTLGAIVREERDAKVVNVSFQGQGLPPIPIPGYVSVMTRVIAAGG